MASPDWFWRAVDGRTGAIPSADGPGTEQPPGVSANGSLLAAVIEMTSLRPKWTECKLKRGLGRLGRIATSPRISPKSPPRFDGRCEGCLADSNLTRTVAVRPGVSSAASYPRAQHWRPGQIRSVAFAGGCRADLRGVAPSCSAGITSCAAGLGRSVASKPPRGRALQKGPAARTDRQRIMINGLRSGRRRRILREHNGGQFGSINRTPSGAV